MVKFLSSGERTGIERKTPLSKREPSCVVRQNGHGVWGRIG
jgi:hypothetical protein